MKTIQILVLVVLTQSCTERRDQTVADQLHDNQTLPPVDIINYADLAGFPVISGGSGISYIQVEGRIASGVIDGVKNIQIVSISNIRESYFWATVPETIQGQFSNLIVDMEVIILEKSQTIHALIFKNTFVKVVKIRSSY